MSGTRPGGASWVRDISRANRRFGLYTPRISEFCFIVGAMKSGTTTLYHYLVQHPAIAANLFQKEPEFFSRPEMPQDLGPYLRQWLPAPFGRRIALEASTGYTKRPALPNVAERLRALPGRKHFVAILRDPVDRIESHLAHNAGRGWLRPDTDLATLAHEIDVSRYAMQLDAYRDAFPDTPVKIVLFEDLKADPLALVRTICTHLEIDPDFAFRRLPPKNIRAAAPEAQAVRLDPALRARLAAELAPDMARLQAEYGVDTARWGFA